MVYISNESLLEFLIANMRVKSALKEDNLKAAFDFYDEQKTGRITLTELRRVFGGVCDDIILVQLLKEVDSDNDNEVKYNKTLNFI